MKGVYGLLYKIHLPNMRNDISIIDVVSPNTRGVSPDQNGPALIVSLDNAIVDNSAVTTEHILNLLNNFDISDPEAIHRVIIVTSEDSHSIYYEDLVSLQKKHHMKLLGVLEGIEIKNEDEEQSTVLRVDTSITDSI